MGMNFSIGPSGRLCLRQTKNFDAAYACLSQDPKKYLAYARQHSIPIQLICPNLPHSYVFVKVSKSIIFLVKSFLRNFYGHLAIFSGHTVPVAAVTRV